MATMEEEQRVPCVLEDSKTITKNGDVIENRSENIGEGDSDGSEATEDKRLIENNLNTNIESRTDSRSLSESQSSHDSDGDEVVHDMIELTELNDKTVTSHDEDFVTSGLDDDITAAALKKIKKNAIACALLTMLIMVIVVLAIIVIVLSVHNSKPPHIVFILAEDLGWNDVGWNNPDVRTPVINKLATEGVLFNWTYVQPMCTPTRAALMTGYYPFKIGMQHQILWNLQRSGLPLELKLLPEKLQEVGYITHSIGKWHLGHCSWDYTPTRRGFDSHYGPLTGGITHYGKMSTDKCGLSALGYDFRDDTGVVQESETYATSMFVERAVKIISEHYSSYPLYLQFSLDIPGKILEVPPEYEAMYSHIPDERTRKYYGKLSLMDNVVGNITNALKMTGLSEQTLLVFMGDNGAMSNAAGSNWPFRGSIGTLFEGAVRVPAFAHGKMLKQKGYVNNEIIHIVDWHSTLLSIAGIKPEHGLDGINMWETMSQNKESPRTEFVYNIDDDNISSSAAIRVDDYKLITGNTDLLYPCRLANKSGGWYNFDDEPTNDVFQGEHVSNETLPPSDGIYLFNIRDDPEERNNTADLYPDIVEKLKARLDVHRKHLVPPVDSTRDLAGDPINYGGVWTPGWC
ncbi:arylsulfatase B-like [Glandiceps talaboti]